MTAHGGSTFDAQAADPDVCGWTSRKECLAAGIRYEGAYRCAQHDVDLDDRAEWLAPPATSGPPPRDDDWPDEDEVDFAMHGWMHGR